MNQIIDLNRTAIVAASMNICKILTTLVNMGAKNHQTYLDLTKEGVYSGSYIETRIKQINDEYKAQAWTYEPKLRAELDAIETAGHELENALEIADSDLASALAIIEASNGKIDMTTEALILKTFQGNQLALRAVKSVYKRWEHQTEGIDKFIFSIDQKMTSLRGHVALITSDPYNNGTDIMGMRRDLINLCKVIGEEVPEEKFDLGENYDALQTARMRKAAGLPAK